MKQLIFTLLFCPALALAQPSTEIYLFDLNTDSEGAMQLSNPINVSNNPGYDNQPSFWPDNQSILYTRTINGQTEIVRYYIQSDKTEVISKTLQGSEYSPTPMPDGRISSIRLDTTGLQLLYAYNLDGENEVLVPKIKIGYHAWLSESDIVAFVLGNPPTLQIIDTNTKQSLVVGDSIGRSLHRIPDSESFSYLDKTKTPWTINAMNPKTGEIKILLKALNGSEDYCWTPSGEIIMGSGSKLYRSFNLTEWFLLNDISTIDLDGITRLAVSPDGKKLAVVVNQ